jgi:hypothetical protein
MTGREPSSPPSATPAGGIVTPHLDLIRRLARENVEFVLVGGMAGVVHGSSLVTQDLDVCARPTPENMGRLLAALRDLAPRDGRGPTAPPLLKGPEELATSSDVSLWTEAGRLDVIWDVPGVGPWPSVRAAAERVDLGEGDSCAVLGLDALIVAKRALGRTRDLVAADELEEIRRRRDDPERAR